MSQPLDALSQAAAIADNDDSKVQAPLTKKRKHKHAASAHTRTQEPTVVPVQLQRFLFL